MSLQEYLRQEQATYNEQTSGLFLERWGESYASLGNWASEEFLIPFETEGISKVEKEKLISIAETSGDSWIIRWSEELSTAGKSAHATYSGISAPLWLYYHYCGFLYQVLREFGRVLLESNGSPVYYERYQRNSEAFGALSSALQRERPFLKPGAFTAVRDAKRLLDNLDSSSVRLGTEWHEAVLSALHSI